MHAARCVVGLIALSATLAGAAPIGPNRVAVVLFNFQNDTRELITPAQADGVVFTNPDSAAAYWQEVSNGAITLSGDVYDWVTIPMDNQAPCPFDLWGQWMDAAVVAAGVNEADYDQILFSFPPAAGCLDCYCRRMRLCRRRSCSAVPPRGRRASAARLVSGARNASSDRLRSTAAELTLESFFVSLAAG